jgi:sulfite reductase (NADPH) flavoprotein alpha-component
VSTPIIPDSAPFNAEQRQWLNGFIAGLLAQQNNNAEAPAGPPLNIFFGSQTGNSEALARGLRKEAQKRGFTPVMADLDSWDPESFGSLERVLIITSTFGEGEPPDNARKFDAWLDAGTSGDLSGMHYSVCALGDSNYPDFCAFGQKINSALSAHGAQCMVDTQICDLGMTPHLNPGRHPFGSTKPCMLMRQRYRQQQSIPMTTMNRSGRKRTPFLPRSWPAGH